ncbi:hypothetical protein MKW92_011887 [Papaver armeniacum]|nr:hypothetical protein MKW92_011887 [Papaver armeniacum]
MNPLEARKAAQQVSKMNELQACQCVSPLNGLCLFLSFFSLYAISDVHLQEVSRSNAQTQQGSSSQGNTKKCSEDSWKNLIDDPTSWWDNRAKKLNPKAPDFRNKVTREGIWLSSAPAWVSDKLPPLQPY